MSIAKSSRAYRTVVMTSLSFAAFALLNSLCANALGASNWALFVPTKRHASNLNEQVLFLMLGNAVLGALLALEGLLRERTRVSWDNKIVSLHCIGFGAILIPVLRRISGHTPYTRLRRSSIPLGIVSYGQFLYPWVSRLDISSSGRAST